MMSAVNCSNTGYNKATCISSVNPIDSIMSNAGARLFLKYQYQISPIHNTWHTSWGFPLCASICAVGILNCCRIEAKLKQLLCHGTVSSTPTEIQPNIMYSIMVKESPKKGVCKGQGLPMVCPSCMQLPNALRVIHSKKLPFQCFEINDQLVW